MIWTIVSVAFFLALPIAVEVLLAPPACVLLLTAGALHNRQISAHVPERSAGISQIQHQSCPSECHSMVPATVEWETAACGSQEQSNDLGIDRFGSLASA
jgi:hypothetical protein